MYSILNIFVKSIGYMAFLFGIWIIVGKDIVLFFQRKLSRFRVEKSNNNPIKRHFLLLLNTTLNQSNPSLFSFFFVSFVIFFINFLVFSSILKDIKLVLFISVFSGLIPYIILRIKLISTRLEGSYEGEKLILELTNQYKINNKNMVEAIDNTIPFLNDCKYTKKALFRLSLRIKEASSIEELKFAIREFVYATETEWANLLGMNIYLAVQEGIDVTEALNDLLEQLKEVKEALESNKRYNNEAFIMIRFFIPLTYILSVFVSVKYFGFTIEKFFEYQFRTSLGLKFGIITFLLIIVNFLLVYILKKPKFDLGA